MTKRMLIDATQAEETRVAVIENDKLDTYDFDSAVRKQIKGSIFLAKVTRVEPSLQACFVEYGGNRQGFLAFTEIHPDYYRIPVEDRQALLAEEAAWDDEEDEEDFPEAPRQRVSEEQPDMPVESNAGESEEPKQGLEALSHALDQAIPQLQGEVELAETPADEITAEASDVNAPNVTEIPRDNTTETVGGDDEDDQQNQRSRHMGRLRRRYKIQEVIKRRQIMLVQATKEERGNKGAAMTTYISLPGRYCVLMPNSPRGGGVSRKITDPQARRKMKELLSELDLPNGMSVILRTAGLTRSRADVKRDLEYLLKLWDEIRRDTMQAVAPALIYEEADIFKRTIRDLYNRDTAEIIIAGEEGYRKVKTFMHQMVPQHGKRVKYYRDPLVPLFQRYNVEAQIANVFKPRVELKSGGYIIINPTEALVSIDVNSGRATRERHIDDTALKTNMEAAQEIARQLRLRDLGGLVVIDFIDMDSSRHNSKVERKLREAMAEDRARIEIGRISGFGLLELSRQRLHPSLTETHFEPCAHCAGTGLVRTTDSAAVVAIRHIEAEAVKGKAVAITASVPVNVAVYILNHKRDELNRMEDYFGCRIAVRADEKMKPNDVEISSEKGTPNPRVKIEELPLPHIEGVDDQVISDEDDGDEPLVDLGDSYEDDQRYLKMDSDDGEDGPGSWRNNRRGGRGGRNSRGGRGGSRRGGRGENPTSMPETVDRYGNVATALITEGAPVDVYDTMDYLLPPTDGNPQAVSNPTDGNGKRRSRRGGARRGGRGRNRDGAERAPRNAGEEGQVAAKEHGGENKDVSERPARRNIPIRQAESATAMASDGNGADAGEKRGWWKKLME